jgi:MFS family permease
MTLPAHQDVATGLRQNLGPFVLLVVVNAFVGAMVGMERSILPSLAETEFGLVASSAVLSFIAVFGVSKAAMNYVAGRLSDRIGRKPVLVAGWLIAAPVPFLLMWAPSWGWVLFANLLLGASQGLCWSTAVVMKIDLAGPAQRGLAMGLNEFAGYLAVALSAAVTAAIAADYGLRPAPFYLGVVCVGVGGLLSVFFVRETVELARQEVGRADAPAALSARALFWRTTVRDPALSSVTQAGFVNNLNDGMAWGLFPLLFAAAGMDLPTIGLLVALYPAVWGAGQLFTGALSDRLGRKGLIVAGMGVQAVGLGLVAAPGGEIGRFALGQILLGLGTAMVYPTLLAAIGDVAAPAWRASAVGVYRLWRDLGYAAGALISGLVADRLGLPAAIGFVALITAASGLFAALRMPETLRRPER